MEIKELISRIERAKNHDAAWAEDMLDACKIAFQTDREFASNRLFALDREIDGCISENVGLDNAAAGNFFEIKKALCKFLAPHFFEYYLLYVEWDREPKKKFYPPRRKVLKPLVDGLQELEERKIKFLGISLPPRVGKSTLCVFFMTWIMGRHPETANVASGHSDKLTDSFYRELLSIITDNVTYHWAEVFPDAPVVDTSAKMSIVNAKKYKAIPHRKKVPYIAKCDIINLWINR